MLDDLPIETTRRRVPRVLVVIGMVVCPPISFVVTLFRESGSAWWHAWNSAMQEIESGKSAWRGEREWRR